MPIRVHGVWRVSAVETPHRSLTNSGALPCAVDLALERPAWRDHKRKGRDGKYRTWTCANRLQRITLTPAIVEIKAALGFQLEQVTAVIGETSKSSGVQLQHLPQMPSFLCAVHTVYFKQVF